jgi:hypothetical protein
MIALLTQQQEGSGETYRPEELVEESGATEGLQLEGRSEFLENAQRRKSTAASMDSRRSTNAQTEASERRNRVVLITGENDTDHSIRVRTGIIIIVLLFDKTISILR